MPHGTYVEEPACIGQGVTVSAQPVQHGHVQLEGVFHYRHVFRLADDHRWQHLRQCRIGFLGRHGLADVHHEFLAGVNGIEFQAFLELGHRPSVMPAATDDKDARCQRAQKGARAPRS